MLRILEIVDFQIFLFRLVLFDTAAFYYVTFSISESLFNFFTTCIEQTLHATHVNITSVLAYFLFANFVEIIKLEITTHKQYGTFY